VVFGHLEELIASAIEDLPPRTLGSIITELNLNVWRLLGIIIIIIIIIMSGKSL